MKNTIEKDWTGNKNSVFKTLGASNHTDKERQNEDYYATDPIAIDVLIRDGKVTFDKPIWECACGRGDLSDRLKDYGYDVYSTDLVYRGYGKGGIDFLTYDGVWEGDVLTNPPYKYAKEFIEHAMEIIPKGRRVFMFLKVQFLEGKARRKLFEKYPPKCVYVSSSRILCAKNAMFDEMKAGGGSAVAYAWFEFEKGYKGRNYIKKWRVGLVIWTLTPTCQNVNYYQLMHMNIALRTRSLIFSMFVMMKNGMIITMTYFKKTTHWNIYTENIWSVIQLIYKMSLLILCVLIRDIMNM